MKIELYPKNMLEALWKEDKKWFSNRVGQIPKCLRCGNPLDSQLLINPLSRHADILVCHQCGTDEAFRDAGKVVLPFQCWYGIEDVRLKDLPESKNPALTSDCAFPDVFHNKEKKTCKIACSRSDYDGYRWWTTWNHCQKEATPRHLTQEIDQFQAALFCMKEFKTLDTMRRFCMLAEPTSSPMEFNLYSETDDLYIWLRMSTQFRNHNLYVHYYRK
ncbi:hypothetical protein QMP26_40015 [Enterocloster clostridioformis]|uniref:hypothetical protein n=1 Tax=Enterocloster clostridioformis TaxID=1531 RepID=UPI002676CC1B|nr:hypothetical protein [Enterocloster clostridioformis]